MIICGIDPGIAGALAVVTEHCDCQILDMPILGSGASTVVNGAMVARFLDEFDVEFAILEQAQAYPGQGVSSSFKTGLTYGQLLGVLQTSLIPYELVSPAVWKKALKLGKDKSLSRLRAMQRFPQCAKQFERIKDHGRAEAALIALWRLEDGQPITSWRTDYAKKQRRKVSSI